METKTVKTTDASKITPGLPIRGLSSWNLVQNRVALVGAALVLLLIFFPP